MSQCTNSWSPFLHPRSDVNFMSPNTSVLININSDLTFCCEQGNRIIQTQNSRNPVYSYTWWCSCQYSSATASGWIRASLSALSWNILAKFWSWKDKSFINLLYFPISNLISEKFPCIWIVHNPINYNMSNMDTLWS